ncbi:glycosyltransferase family 4 protein [Prevotella sp. 10(H)]|uniref:glycosyltransferase family 4 protein n=1 Tax=Prevotella sp. 10(H) TaxID=1158294 RepID=UPI0004A72050|nr:glycosyltransferase family 4 protein [Prevotella sp. 10(H)]
MTKDLPKILFILHMPPPIHGASIMGQYIYESKIINNSFECKYINLGTAKNLEDIGKAGLKKIYSFFIMLMQIKKVIQSFNPDVVYVTPNATGISFLKDFLVVRMIKSQRVKVVAHYHNKGVAAYQDKFIYNFCYKRFFKDLNIILLADVLHEDLKKYVNKRDINVCPNGIPLPNKINNVEKKDNLAIPHILFLSNLIKSKGIFILLGACKILKDKGFSFVCEIIGGETQEIDRNVLNDKIAELKLQDSVIYHGKKYGEEKNTYLQNASLFVFPTFYSKECFPVVLLEAMQYGIPCISTDEAGIPAIIEHGKTGLLCRRQSVDDLADAMEKLLDDPELAARLGSNGYQKYLDSFTIGSFENKIKEILSSLI